MSSLADLIEKRRENLDVQRTVSIQMRPDEASWRKQKKLINNLSSDYAGILRDRLAQDPRLIRKTEFDKNYSILIFFPEYSEKYKTLLEILEHKEKGVVNVTYLTYNRDTNTYYIRDIVGNKFK